MCRKDKKTGVRLAPAVHRDWVTVLALLLPFFWYFDMLANRARSPRHMQYTPQVAPKLLA